MTKKIIVPTDFSENAFSAAKYACEFAMKNNYAIHLFHFYTSKTSIFDEKLNEKEDFNPLMRGDILMNECKNSLSVDFPQLNIETFCKEGIVSESIPKLSRDSNYSLIIMGSDGISDDDSATFGSTTYQIAAESKIPVLAIPNNLSNHDIKRIALLTNFKEDELDSLKDFISLMNIVPQLDIIHVYQNSDDILEVERQIKEWSKKIKDLTTITEITEILEPITYSDESLDTIAEVINSTINRNNYDIVLVTKTRKSFFDKWFSRSISKEVLSKLESTTFFDNN